MRGGIGSLRGFTLIEVLLAMAILAVIMAVIYTSFSTASNNIGQAEAARDATDLARTLLAKITDDIANAYYNSRMSASSLSMGTTVNPTIFSGKKIEAGIGNEQVRHDSLTLTTLTNQHKPGTNETELKEVEYFFSEKPEGSGYSLSYREKRELSADQPPGEGGAEYELTDKVTGLRFRYYNGSQWVDEWNATSGSGQPQRVEVTLTLDTGSVYMTEVEVLNNGR